MAWITSGTSPNWQTASTNYTAGVGDSTPDVFNFINQSNVALDTQITPAPVAITGIDTPSTISITGGQYRIDGGSWTSSSGTIDNNSFVEVLVTSSSEYATGVSATLTVGGVSSTFTATTLFEVTDSDLEDEISLFLDKTKDIILPLLKDLILKVK